MTWRNFQLSNWRLKDISKHTAGVAELVDARRLGRRSERIVGSIPAARTTSHCLDGSRFSGTPLQVISGPQRVRSVTRAYSSRHG